MPMCMAALQNQAKNTTSQNVIRAPRPRRGRRELDEIHRAELPRTMIPNATKTSNIQGEEMCRPSPRFRSP